ncbi:hypothetical protein ACIQCD_06880 [Streptomyces sp. NPDC093250]|uniref:hypothetical protein n=1 Tax=Streptomyces sp. NPDC093250 TaxID=3366036 RepID=UPI0038093A63
MTVKLNAKAFNHAKKLTQEGKIVLDDRDEWSEHQPSAAEENAYLEEHGFKEYARWYLAIDDERGEETKGHYKFPYGDFERVHRCGVLSAEVRAARQKYTDIENAAAHLHGLLDGKRAGNP